MSTSRRDPLCLVAACEGSSTVLGAASASPGSGACTGAGGFSRSRSPVICSCPACMPSSSSPSFNTLSQLNPKIKSIVVADVSPKQSLGAVVLLHCGYDFRCCVSLERLKGSALKCLGDLGRGGFRRGSLVPEH